MRAVGMGASLADPELPTPASRLRGPGAGAWGSSGSALAVLRWGGVRAGPGRGQAPSWTPCG